MRIAFIAVALAGCVQSAAVVCDDGRICPIGTVCDDARNLCISSNDQDGDTRLATDDCDDHDPLKGGAEVSADGIDNDCDGLVDCDDDDVLRAVEIHGDGLDQDCNAPTKLVFELTQHVELLEIPPAVTSIDVKVWGAGGGFFLTTQPAGAGGYAGGILSVTPGETLTIMVGGPGKPGEALEGPAISHGGPGGYGGGGDGGDCLLDTVSVDAAGAGGGGASEVSALAGILTAGGGGGTGYGVDGVVSAGGGAMGESGDSRTPNYGDGTGGADGVGGGAGVGGAGGTGGGYYGAEGPGVAGTATTGGKGGSTTAAEHRCRGGGGGGGGYGGGGGGGVSYSWSGGVGGGGGGRTISGGELAAGSAAIPAHAGDADRGNAGDPGAPGRVVIVIPD